VVRARDIGWAVLICLLLTFVWDCRPARDARLFVERESQAGFDEAYTGHRFISGELIVKPGAGGGHADPMAVEVTARRFEIKAQRTSFSGRSSELVVRHVIKLMDGTAEGHDASQEIHVRLAKQDGHWVYVLFEVRGRGEIEGPNESNPWARALRQEQADEEAPSG